MILVADNGVARSMAEKSSPAGNGFSCAGIDLRSDGRVRGHECNQVADVHHPDRIIQAVIVDDQPRMGGVLEYLDEIAERDVLLHRNDVGARHHEIAETPFAQAQDVFDHPAFFRRKSSLDGGAVQQRLEIRADRGRTPAEHGSLHTVEPGFAGIARKPVGAACQSGKIALPDGGAAVSAVVRGLLSAMAINQELPSPDA